MAALSREELKRSFRNGSLAREENFSNLIDSFVHINDDRSNNSANGAFGLPNINKSIICFRTKTDKNGNANVRVGINTQSPITDFDVNGSIGMKSRIGNFSDSSVNPELIIADGHWHNVLTNLNNLTALEIMSAVYCPGGKHAMYYTVLTNAFGKGCKIKPIQQSHSSWWHRIQMRWTSGTHGQYGLAIRTACSYKTKPIIQNRITKLWN